MVDVQAPEEDRSTSARITVIVQRRYLVDAGSTTGKRIKDLAGIPADFTLYRRAEGGMSHSPTTPPSTLGTVTTSSLGPPASAGAERHGSRALAAVREYG